MAPKSRTHRTVAAHIRWTSTLATAAALAIALPASAQTPPPATPPAAAAPAPAAPSPDQDAAKQHLTAARNTLSELTQLPAASQLAGEPRTQVQQLISNFNELITTNSNWRASYAKVEGTLAALLPSEPASPASGTPGAVGTSGTAPTIDPAIRAKLVEFRQHLAKFEAVANAASPAPNPTPAATTSSTTTTTSTTTTEPPPPTAPPAAATPPAAAATTSTTSSTTTTTAATEERPDSPPVPASAQEMSIVPQDVLVHVEAVEVILGAQAAANKAATAAAGGVVTSADTVSGSTRTTIVNPDVTLNSSQLEQIKNHLAEIRRVLEKK